MKIKHLLLISLIFISGIIKASEKAIEITSEDTITERYAQIDTSKEDKFFNDLFYNDDIKDKESLIKDLRANVGLYNPSSLYVAGAYLITEGRSNEAIRFYLLARLRATFDNYRSIDKETISGVMFLNVNYGEIVAREISRDISSLEKHINSVIEFDKKTPYNYNPEWLNKYSSKAYDKNYDSKFLVSKKYWKSLHKKAVNDFKEYFLLFLESSKRLD